MLAAVLLVNQAAAFAPEIPALGARPTVRSSGVSMQEKSTAVPFVAKAPMLDPNAPGYSDFDPLQLSSLIPLKWAQEAELKHGRVCMLAVVGWVAVDLGFRVPEAPAVSSLAAHDATVEKGPMFMLLLACSIFEIIAGTPKAFQLMDKDLEGASAPGDYGFNPLNFNVDDTMRTKEIANGRLAMLAFSGIVTQAALTGSGFPYTG